MKHRVGPLPYEELPEEFLRARDEYMRVSKLHQEALDEAATVDILAAMAMMALPTTYTTSCELTEAIVDRCYTIAYALRARSKRQRELAIAGLPPIPPVPEIRSPACEAEDDPHGLKNKAH